MTIFSLCGKALANDAITFEVFRPASCTASLTLYPVQPVYLVSTGNIKIPELARIILSMGNIVVMDTSLEGAWNQLESRLRNDQRFTPEGIPDPNAQPTDEKQPKAGPM